MAEGVAVDSSGNGFVTGYFRAAATFGTNPIYSAGREDIFVAKCNSAGQFLWVTRAGGTNFEAGQAIVVDPAGNCYVTGEFVGTASFGVTNLVGISSDGFGNMFLAKYDGAGNLIWATQAGTPQNGSVAGTGIGVDADGNTYVTGSYVGPAHFGNITLSNTAFGPSDKAFLAKYGPDGSALWAVEAGLGRNYSFGAAVAVGSGGGAYLTGTSEDDLNLQVSYLAPYDNGGNLVWSTAASTNSPSYSHGVAVDSGGNVLMAGSFSGTFTLSGVTLTSRGGSDGFLAKYSSAGSLLWINQIGGTNNDGAGSVTFDKEGNSFVVVALVGAATLGTNLVGSGVTQEFVAKYDGSGELMWAAPAGGAGAHIFGIASQPATGVYITGQFTGQARFGDTVLVSGQNIKNIFVARIDEAPILSATETSEQMVLSWPTNQVGFALQRAIALASGAEWARVTNPVQVVGSLYTVTDQPSGMSSFYRLWKP